MANSKHISIKETKKKSKKIPTVTVIKRNTNKKSNSKSPVPKPVFTLNSNNIRLLARQTRKSSNKPRNTVIYPRLSNIKPIRLNNYFTLDKSSKSNAIYNILTNKSNKHNVYDTLTNFFLYDEIAQFFAWLDSTMVTSKIAPTIKAIYKHPNKVPIKPDCLTLQQITYRKMVAKCIRYGEDCTSELIKYFIKHYENIIERTDRCGLDVNEFIKNKLEKWTAIGMPFVV